MRAHSIKLTKTCGLPSIVTLRTFISFNVFIIVQELFFISLTFSNGSKNDVQILTINTVNHLQEVIVNISNLKNRREISVRLFFMGLILVGFSKLLFLFDQLQENYSGLICFH